MLHHIVSVCNACLEVMDGVDKGQTFVLAACDDLDVRSIVDPGMLEFFTPMCIVYILR